MRSLVTFVTAGMLAAASIAAADPPQIVARISFTSGPVSYRAAAAVDWAPASLNYPVTIGDNVWTDRTGRTELQLGPTSIRVAASTSLGILNLDNHVAQLRLTAGSIALGVHDLGEDDALEVDTPNGAINVLRPGFYRIDVSDSGEATSVTVRHGEAEVAAGGSAFAVRANQTAFVNGVVAPTSDVVPAIAIDEFDDWAVYRDRRAENPVTVRYVSRGIVGYEDLDDFGAWRIVASYGPVWVPHVRADWVPYRFGHWAWVEPWGWTWIDDSPWGFAPFHYGRWVYLTDRWAWVPGTIVARPVYAPALVAFVGGSNFRVSVSISEPIAWFPLGPREIYVPAYRVTPEYVRAVNVAHVNVTNVNVTTINVTNVTYVNRSVPGAVTAVSRDAFVRAQPVSTAAIAVPRDAVASAAVVGHAAPIAAPPRPAAVRVAVAAPPPAVINRPVIVRAAPPASMAAAVKPATVARPAPRVVAAAPPLAAQPAVAAGASRPPHAGPAPGPAAAGRPPSSPPAATAAPDRAAAEIMARQAQERVALENRHAQERAEMLARQRQQEQQARDEQARSGLRAQHKTEQQTLDQKQRRDHEQIEKRQEQERKRRERS